jgi:hypothetical protein
MRLLAQNITRIATRKVSSSTNNMSLTVSRIANRKESTAVKPITTPKDIRHAIKFPSACSGVNLSDRVTIVGASNTVSCFLGAAVLGSSEANIDQGEQSKETEQPNNVSQMPPTGDDISLRWDAPTGGDINRNDAPLSPMLPLENSYVYCFETPPQAAAMMGTPMSPPPSPRPDHAMIHCIRPPIPEELLVPLF